MDRRASPSIVHRAALVALMAVGCSRPEARMAAPRAQDACAARSLPVASGAPLAPLAEPPAGRVARIVVRGLKRVPESLVRRVIMLESGDPLDLERIARDVVALHALEVFDDVSVRYELARGGAIVVYELRERPPIRSLRIRGERRYAAELGLMEGALYEPARAHERARELEQSWRADGHQRARVRLTGVRSSDGVELCATLERGPRITIERFEFAGARVVAVHELRAEMQTDSGRINTPGGVYRRDVLADDLLRFSALHWDRGLLSAETKPIVEQSGDRLRITIQIDEGPVYRIGKLSISGERLAPEAKYRALLGISPGDVFSRAELMAAFERIGEFHREQGRADLELQPETVLDRERARVDLKLVVKRP